MDKIEGCNFTLNSDTEISFPNNNLDIELVYSGKKNNLNNTNWDIKENQIKSIICKINDNISNNYSLKNDIITYNNKYIIISISDDNDKFAI